VPCGIAVTLCRSAAEALAALEDTSFDAILTDYDMPEMNGLGLTRTLRARGIETPIILLTSNPSACREEAGYDQVTAVLQKPILRADLYRRLNDLYVPHPEARLMRVLVAEDNRTNQLVFQKMVRDVNIELVFANNGLEAVSVFQSWSPDMIFMDISMPEMDGRDAARAIRTLEAGASHVPIVAVTAHALEGDEAGILAAGIDHYMTKPLRKALILNTLSSFCPESAYPVVVSAA